MGMYVLDFDRATAEETDEGAHEIEPPRVGKRSLTAAVGRRTAHREAAPGKRARTAQLKARGAATGAPSSLRLAATGPGVPLPAAIARIAAAVLGDDVGGVRVHV